MWAKVDSGEIVPLDPQTRLVLFDGPTEDLVEPLSIFEHGTGRVVWGRAATKDEAAKYSKCKDPGLSFALGRRGHWHECKRLDLWIGGEAKTPSALAR